MNHIDKIIERVMGDSANHGCSYNGIRTVQITVEELRALLQEVTKEYRKDAARLNFLDTNLRFSIGWNVSQAPKGNIVVRDVVFLGTNKPVPIREAIDAAIAAEGK